MIELAAILARYLPAYLQKYSENIPENHLKTVNDMLRCRTPENGGTTYYCKKCDAYVYSYHSCGNRNCNKCQNELIGAWFEKAKLSLLPTGHFLVTFTLPGALRKMARCNQRLFYGLLFKAASQALQHLAYDTRYCGGLLGMIAVLHTWGRNLSYHPHVHFIVTAGGLFSDEGLWLPSKQDFLVPVKALSIIFRAKFRDLLKQSDIAAYNRVNKECPDVWRKKWVVHCEGVGDGQAALKYLAAYVFKPALSNKRILYLKDGKVRFEYRDTQTKRWTRSSLDVLAFIHRYLQHVLPKGFVKVRYMGIYAHAAKEKRERAKKALPKTKDKGNGKKERENRLSGKDLENMDKALKRPCCPKCKGLLTVFRTTPKIFYYSNGPPRKQVLLKSIHRFLASC